jgi:hypothetical protein
VKREFELKKAADNNDDNSESISAMLRRLELKIDAIKANQDSIQTNQKTHEKNFAALIAHINQPVTHTPPAFTIRTSNSTTTNNSSSSESNTE